MEIRQTSSWRVVRTALVDRLCQRGWQGGVALLILADIACGSGNATHAGTTGGGGEIPSASTTVNRSSTDSLLGTGGAAASGGFGGHGGSSGTGGSGGGEDGGATDGGLPESVCLTTATWAPGVALSITATAPILLGGVTPDEKTIAWVTGPEGSAVVHYADRTDLKVPFDTPSTLQAPPSGAALDRVALSPDGLRIGVVRADRHAFVEYTRGHRGDAFSEAGSGTFALINATGASFSKATSFGDPVIAADDQSLVYSIYGRGDKVTIQYSARLFSGDPWAVASSLGGAALEAQGTLRRRPTGISSDLRTLFFWDDVSATERAGFRSDWLADFTAFVDLGTLTGAIPNAACDALYYACGVSETDLFRANRN